MMSMPMIASKAPPKQEVPDMPQKQVAIKAAETSFAHVLDQKTNVTTQNKNSKENNLTWRNVQKIAQAATKELDAADITEMTSDVTLNRLMKMLKELLNGEGKGLTADDLTGLLKLGQELQQRVKEIAEEDGQETAMQMLAGLFAQLPQEVPAEMIVQATPAEFLQVLHVLPQDVATALVNQNASIVIGDDLLVPKEPAEVQSKPIAAAAETDPSVAKAQADTNAVQVKHSDVKQDPQATFQSAVRQAKERLAQAGNSEPKADKQPVDADTLQKQVDSGLHLRNTAFSTAMDIQNTEQPIPVATQIQDGLVAAMEKGAKEYSIKLMPEGLGELTLRLTKAADGSMTLNMVAKNAETQKMLAAELHQLREVLKPLQVDVETVLTQQQDMLMNQQREFSQHAGQDWRTFKGAAYYGDEPLGRQEDTGFEVAEQTFIDGAALNAYI